MNKRLGTLIAALVLSAAAEVHGAGVPTKQPGPSPKPNPSTCPAFQRCSPPTTCPPWRRCSPKIPAPLPCGGPGQAPCWR